MNNKPGRSKNLQPDTAAEGDSSINTKKGFLISLPNRKKKSNEESGIVPAKTVSNPPVEKNERSAKPTRESAERNTAQPQKNRQDRNRPKSADNAAKSDRRNDRPRGDKNKPETSEKSEKNERNDKNAQHAQDAPNRRDNRDKNNNRGAGKNPGGKDGANKESKENKDGKMSENRSGRGNAKDTRKGQNDRKNDRSRPQKGENAGREKSSDRSDTRSKTGKNDRKGRGRMPSLSPLSGDMMSFSEKGGHTEQRVEKEPSFEEKYANAVPLAEQIAAEEAKRLARLRACNTAAVTHKASPEQTDDGATLETEAVKRCEIVGIRFREAGKIYYFDPDGQNIPYGTPVVVETSRGAEYGYTAIANRTVPIESVVAPLKKIKRLANRDDTDKYRANKELEAEAATIFKQKVAELKLAMNLVFVEYTFDNSKLLFYFTAETRIDFRELVKELASIFRTRIELRQIGVRDEAKMLGGLGVCGRTVCCNSFLDDFAQVSIKMAKEQGLSLNSTKISGACGKLMCCLRFEDKVYSEETARTPRVGSVVETREGRGTVVETNPLKGEVKVSLENTPDAPPKVFSRDEVKHPMRERNAEATEAKPEPTDKSSDGEQA